MSTTLPYTGMIHLYKLHVKAGASTELYVHFGHSWVVDWSVASHVHACVQQHDAVAEGGCHLSALGPQRMRACQGHAQWSGRNQHGGVEERIRHTEEGLWNRKLNIVIVF